MKKMIPYLACFLVMVTLAPCLHAQQPPAPAVQADLAAQIFAPVAPAASTAGPVQAVPSDLFPSAPRLATCTVQVCEADCNDCPIPKHPFCKSLTTCVCGCR